MARSRRRSRSPRSHSSKERHSRRQGGRGAFGHQVVESKSIDLDPRWLQGDRVSDRPECLGLERSQRPAKTVESLTQIRLRLAVGAVAPEQGGKFVARMRAAWRTGQIGQKRSSLPGPEGDDSARFKVGDFQAPEERDAQHAALF